MCTALGVEWASPHRSESQDDGCRLGSLGRNGASVSMSVKARTDDGCRLCSLGNGASVYSQ